MKSSRRKKKEIPLDHSKAVVTEAERFENAHNEVAKAYLNAVLQLLYFQKWGELNYLKKTIKTPEGGIYLLQIQHVDGPIIDVQKSIGPEFD